MLGYNLFEITFLSVSSYSLNLKMMHGAVSRMNDDSLIIQPFLGMKNGWKEKWMDERFLFFCVFDKNMK